MLIEFYGPYFHQCKKFFKSLTKPKNVTELVEGGATKCYLSVKWYLEVYTRILYLMTKKVGWLLPRFIRHTKLCFPVLGVIS